ncbi:MAG: hypothetical protein MI747_00940 [Desulfobacterales bacterium]|nr:hypothetical protein [Desulfobacterales bacterium]
MYPLPRFLTPWFFSLALVVFGAVFCGPAAGASGCTTKDCHGGIENIVSPERPMMQLLRQNGQRHGDFDGCIICHGGNPRARDKERAHQGVPKSLSRVMGPKAFYPDPGDLSVVDNSCGVCHIGYGGRMGKSLMNTEAGKIQGNFTAWGLGDLMGSPLGNQAVVDQDGPIPAGGSPEYAKRMAGLAAAYPDQFPTALAALPQITPAQVEARPALAGVIYQRRECQRCHLGTRGIPRPGDFRGLGCAACHIPYGQDGLYRGKDKTIPRDQPGKLLRHRIQGNRKTGGIPVASCQVCHNRGKRIGTSFGGAMETPHRGGFDARGNPQSPNHGKYYMALPADVHHRPVAGKGPGMLCQDCHTSMDVHGNGNLTTTTLGQVEIECSDCHGTPWAFPWELPLGYGDEFGRKVEGKPRGVAPRRSADQQRFGFDYGVQDGYLISTRGNALGNVVRVGEGARLHSARGHDLEVPLLKARRATWDKGDSPGAAEARTAMVSVAAHLKTMECYTCHSGWAPQCYGCHVKVDFSDPTARGRDWAQPDSAVSKHGEIPGAIRESNGYMAWEDPMIGINGEGRVSPIVPGCQVVHTVVDGKGKVLAAGAMARNPAEAGELGLASPPLALDTAPVQPHTTGRARSCESCHSRPATLGKGGIRAAGFNWSRLVDEAGVQQVTVGSHWPLSRALNRAEVDKVLRTGVCTGCHGHMDKPEIWRRVSTDQVPDTPTHQALMGRILKGELPRATP